MDDLVQIGKALDSVVVEMLVALIFDGVGDLVVEPLLDFGVLGEEIETDGHDGGGGVETGKEEEESVGNQVHLDL